MWRGFETALQEETATWRQIGASLSTPGALLGAVWALAAVALVVHYLD